MKQNIIKITHSNENMTPIIYQILAELDDAAENIIEFEKGTYKFYRAGSINRMLYASSRKACSVDIIFDIIGKKNLTIDGNGSDFVFCDRVNPFYLLNCENIVFKNFTMDYSFLRYAYADILEVSNNGFLINIDKNVSDYKINEDKNIEFICGEDAISTKYKKISTRSIPADNNGIFYIYVGDNEARLNPAAPHIYVDAIEQGDNVFMKYRDNNENKLVFSENSTICLAYDNEREAQAFFAEYCKNISVDNISIYRNGGMGFVADLCEDISINRYNLALKPGRREYYSSTADGIFITNCAGNFSLTNSCIRDTYDDAINIHGYYLQVDEVLSDSKVRLVHKHDSHNVVPYFADDIIHISDENMNEFKTAIVKDVSFEEDRRTNIILTLNSTEGLKSGMLVENPDRMPNVIIENNTIINCPHMRLSSGNMIIKNNNLELNMGDVYIDDLATFWQESGAVKNVEIVGNTFGDAGTVNIVVRSRRPETSNHLHGKVLIKGNKFKLPRDKALDISAVREAHEDSNEFCTNIKISQ